MSLDIQPVLVFADGTPVSSLNPLPTTGGGGGGTVDQGAANGDAAKGWSTRLTDGTAFIVPAKTGQLPAALGATTAAGSMSVGIATDQLATLATAAKQDTSNAALTSIDTKLTAPLSVMVVDGANAAAVLNAAPTTQYGLVTRNIPAGTQAVSAASLPLPTGAATSALQGGGLPAALVGGRLDVNTGAWLGSTTPTVGQKAMSASLPVTIASDQSTLPIAQQSATYSVISTSTTTVVAGAAITLYKIFWAAGVGSTLAAYDNGVGGTTNQFASKLTSTDGEIDFGPLGVRLSSGLTVVTTGGTPAYITVILRS